jgi:RNA polymerase sigma-70 factor (ECF subfamily)
MGHDTELETSTTLLRRLRRDPADESAWGDFVDRYGRLLYAWCRHWGLNPADAEDVCQDVLLELARQMRGFVYDPNGRFRGWLRTVAYRSWCRFVAGRRAAGARPDLETVLAPAAGEDFLDRLGRDADRELLRLALDAVRRRVQPRTWDAFVLLALEGLPGAEAARRLGMTPGAAFVARSKVQKMLREEVRRLDEGP